MRLPVGQETPYIRTWVEDAGVLSVPRGGMGRVRELLREAGVPFEVVDARLRRGPVATPDHKLECYPYQREAIDACIAREQCILRAPTGCGKTVIVAKAGKRD